VTDCCRVVCTSDGLVVIRSSLIPGWEVREIITELGHLLICWRTNRPEKKFVERQRRLQTWIRSRRVMFMQVVYVNTCCLSVDKFGKTRRLSEVIFAYSAIVFDQSAVLSHVNKEQPPNCNYCKTPLTVEHNLTSCSAYKNIREKHYSNSQLSPTNASKQHIFNYLSEINICNKLLFSLWHIMAYLCWKCR